MAIRRLRIVDVPALEEIHLRAGYGFAFPENITDLPTAFVLEEDGRVVGFAGGDLQAEIIGIFDPEWGSPHQRMRTFAALHLPIAQALDRLRVIPDSKLCPSCRMHAKGHVRKAVCNLDPKWKRFGKRLSQLGWNKALWETHWMSVKSCVDALIKRAG